MYRIIKFRGKRIDNNKWIYGDLLQPTEFDNIYEISDKDTIDGTRYEINPETIGQFTGLRDKNGKEIFEGDILQIDIDKAYVKWNNKYGYFQLVPIDDYYFDSDVIGQALEYLKVEVIGNVFDSKNLLEGDK